MRTDAGAGGAVQSDGASPAGWPLLLGVRHHGPGSARAVRAALDQCQPSAVLIEGPPEADALVALAADEGMRPPVALLAHAVDDPGRAAFWPMAAFSPEWVAIRWAVDRGVPVRFIDLPAAHSLAWTDDDPTGPTDPTGPPTDGGPTDPAAAPPSVGGSEGPRSAGPSGAAVPGAEPGGYDAGPGGHHADRRAEHAGGPGVAPPDLFADLPVDPLAVLAEAAGYDDAERWWEDVVEHRAAPACHAAAGGGAAAGPPPAGSPAGSPARPLERPASGVSGEPAADPGRGSSGAASGGVSSAAPGRASCAEAAPGGVSSRAARDREPTGSAVPVAPGPDDACAPFAALAEAMSVLRAEYGTAGRPRDAVREAHMRLALRAARREHGERIAVVCGAWHVPALAERTTQAADRRLLKGLPKVKAGLSWVPWTHRRLCRHSGYGAGITSPGWYHHLFEARDRPVERWLTRIAGLLRSADHPVSSAHVIEAVRLAETLAAVRGRPCAGLAETLDAVRAVMCDGSDVPLALIQDALVVGDVLGEVPEAAPAVPLQRDLTRRQRALRMKPEAAERQLALDLRKETDAERSRLLHRLGLLGIGWGELTGSRGATGTFRETWRLRWEPELSVRVAEAGMWGTTVPAAAVARAEATAQGASALGEVTALAERCLLAGLSDALPVVMRALADLAALDTDVGHLAEALPALVRSVRYGDVRGTDTAALTDVTRGLADRLLVGLPPACVGLDAEGAAEMCRHVEAVHQAIGLVDHPSEASAPVPPVASEAPVAPDAPEAPGPGGAPHTPLAPHTPATPPTAYALGGPQAAAAPAPPDHGDPSAGGAGAPDSGQDTAGARRSGDGAAVAGAAGEALPTGLRTRWTAVLRGLAGQDAAPGLIRGRAARLLLDDGCLTTRDAARLMGRALSPGTAPVDGAAWIQGFLGDGTGGGLLLVHDERLLGLVDDWLTGVSAEAFTDVLPLLRRTFSGYEPGVRRTLGELVRRGRGPAGSSSPGAWSGAGTRGFAPGVDAERATAVLPTLRLLLGLELAAAAERETHQPPPRPDPVPTPVRLDSAPVRRPESVPVGQPEHQPESASVRQPESTPEHRPESTPEHRPELQPGRSGHSGQHGSLPVAPDDEGQGQPDRLAPGHPRHDRPGPLSPGHDGGRPQPEPPDRGRDSRSQLPPGHGGQDRPAPLAAAADEPDQDERLRRWRLVLGGTADGTGHGLGDRDAGMDRTLQFLYGDGGGGPAGDRGPGAGGTSGRAGRFVGLGSGAPSGGRRSGGLGGSAPQVARWLGDIRGYFPTSVVQVMQRDAIDRLGLTTLLLEPETLESFEADVHLVGTLLSLNKAMPETTRTTARTVVRRVVDDLEKRLESRARATISGALDRARRTHRPRHRDIDWDRTIRANLRHYLPEYRTVVPERLVGYRRAARGTKKDVILCIDQSGSMAASVVYASVFGAVLASMRALSTRLVVFDTAVVDLTDQLHDPVDVLFGTQLGGGTDINRALAYCQSLISRPADTVVVLISDLYEGGIRDEMLRRVRAMKAAGVQFLTLLALSDEGAPAYDHEHAAALAELGSPAFACTPDLFPEVMAAALEKRQLPIPEKGLHQ